MNISRGVLRRAEFQSCMRAPLHTWADLSGVTWFGVARVSFGYVYLNLDNRMYAFYQHGKEWVNVNQFYNPWRSIP